MVDRTYINSIMELINEEDDDYKLTRLQDIVQNEEYIIAYGYSNDGEGIFQKYYFENGRWQLLRCKNLPYCLYDFSMVLYRGHFLIINGKKLLDDSTYTTRIGYLSEQGLIFEEIGVSNLNVNGKWLSQRILTDNHFLFIVASHISKETEISVYNIDITTKQWKLHNVSSKSLSRQNPKCQAVYYNNRIFMFTHTLPNDDDESLIKFEVVDVFDLTADRWEQIETLPDSSSGHRPSARVNFEWSQCTTDEHHVYMTGGYDTASFFLGVWRLDMRTARWSNVSSRHNYGPPCPHRVAISPAGALTYVMDHPRMVRLMRTVPVMDPTAYIWMPMGDVRMTAAPSPRNRYCANCQRYRCRGRRVLRD